MQTNTVKTTIFRACKHTNSRMSDFCLNEIFYSSESSFSNLHSLPINYIRFTLSSNGNNIIHRLFCIWFYYHLIVSLFPFFRCTCNPDNKATIWQACWQSFSLDNFPLYSLVSNNWKIRYWHLRSKKIGGKSMLENGIK